MQTALFLGITLMMPTLIMAEATSEVADPFLWLEEVTGEKALEWVESRNETSLEVLTEQPGFDQMNSNLLTIYNSDDRIPEVWQDGGYLYNFWKDATHVRGVLRRTSQESYLADKTDWDTVLDIDALAKKDDENWVYKGIDCRYPEHDRCLISLSRGGADATVIREFDLKARSFVDKGFHLPEAKSAVSWLDIDTLLVGTDMGEGSMTDSGYPRVTRVWKRGSELKDAPIIHEASATDLGVFSGVFHDKQNEWPFLYHGIGFYSRNYLLYRDGKLTPLDIPQSAEVSTILNNELIVQLKEDWTPASKTLTQGSIISIGMDELLAGSHAFTTIIAPDEASSVQSIATTQDYLIATVMRDVNQSLYRYHKTDQGWQRLRIPLPGFGSIELTGESDSNNQLFVSYESFLKPTTQLLLDAKFLTLTESHQLPAFFDAENMLVEQLFTTADDGVRIPYFVIRKKGIRLDGSHPTLLSGYGGFEVSRLPGYSGSIGSSWLADGGIYVLANIRGGGEYGPRWHQAALLKNRHVAFNDFISVAEDLIERKVTSPKHLGIMGGSNGGLLVGAVFTMRPDLFNAVVCAVPLLDMKRYNKLLAGASWMAEYGNPDEPDMWSYIRTYSPYHNLDKDKEYPRVFFTTSTRDDRVHPAHARKMVARMQEQGHDVLYYENTEGGHAGASNNAQSAHLYALIYTYLKMQLTPKG